jgi:hypothetical protein
MAKEEGADGPIASRVRRVQEDIMGNEALGGGSLDESAASELLSLGLRSAEGIASATSGMDDDVAELSMSERLQALRKLMRHLGRLLGEGMSMDVEGRVWLWDSIQAQARLLYGEGLQFPALEDVMGSLSQGESPAGIISDLRSMFESQKDKFRGA